MAITVRYQPENNIYTYPTLAQAQMAEFLEETDRLYLEHFRIEMIVEALDSKFHVFPRDKEPEVIPPLPSTNVVVAVVETKEEKNETL